MLFIIILILSYIGAIFEYIEIMKDIGITNVKEVVETTNDKSLDSEEKIKDYT